MRLLLALSVLILSACVQPPDFAVCRPLEMRSETKLVDGIGQITVPRPNPKCMATIGESVCGFCVWTISNKIQYVGESKKTWHRGKPWSRIRKEAALVPAEDFAKVKEFVINICKKSEECNKDIERWRLKLDVFSNAGN